MQVLSLEFESALFDFTLDPLQIACCDPFATLCYERNDSVKAKTLSHLPSQG